MARNVWTGASLAVAQVSTFTVGGTAAGSQVYTVTINGKAVSYTATGGDTNTTIAAGLKAALAASEIPEFVEVTWTVSATVVTGTAATAGYAFTATAGATGTGSLTAATPTASAGPLHWDTAKNWSAGTVPVDGEDIDLLDWAGDIKFGLDQSSIQPASLNIYASFTGQIGLSRYNTDNGDGYVEYRERSLKIGPATLNIGMGEGSGSSFVRINTGTDQTTLNLYNAARPTKSTHAVQWQGTHASNVLNLLGGSFAAADAPDESATAATINIGRGSTANGAASEGSGTVYLGRGVTWTTINKASGSLDLNSGGTTLNNYGGETTQREGNLTTLSVWRGRFAYNGAGTISAMEIGSEGIGDLSQSMRSCTISAAVVMHANAQYLNPHRRGGASGLTVEAKGCTLADLVVDFGFNVSASITAL